MPSQCSVLAVKFRSDADLGGVKKISISEISTEFLEQPYEPLKPLHRGSFEDAL